MWLLLALVIQEKVATMYLAIHDYAMAAQALNATTACAACHHAVSSVSAQAAVSCCVLCRLRRLWDARPSRQCLWANTTACFWTEVGLLQEQQAQHCFLQPLAGVM